MTLALILTGGTALTASGGNGKGHGAASTYYTLAQDFRKCAYPNCGGQWVTAANQALTTCADGSDTASCYVLDVDFSHLGLSDSQVQDLEWNLAGVVVTGKFKQTNVKGWGKYGVFIVSDAWRAPTAAVGTDTFYKVTELGFVCAKHPCNNIGADELNTGVTGAVSGLDLTASGATQGDLIDAYAAMDVGNLLVAGFIDADGFGGTTLFGSQFYLPVIPGECFDANDCTPSVYHSFVKNPGKCYCPFCPQPLSADDAQANADSWFEHCANNICPQPKCAQPPPVDCVDGNCGWAPLEF